MAAILVELRQTLKKKCVQCTNLPAPPTLIWFPHDTKACHQLRSSSQRYVVESAEGERAKLATAATPPEGGLDSSIPREPLIPSANSAEQS